jgi:dTDP-4-dehydrorhamnose 3,5-epimerase
MKVIKRKIKGVYEIDLEPHKDKRGFFMRVYDEKIFKEFGLHRDWVQENHSRSLQKGIIRGLHFQFPPYAETKLIRAMRGSIFDVFVDLRKNSLTFGQWDSIVLSEDKFNCAYVPRGFAHGFCTLTPHCEVIYKVDNYYVSEHEGGIIWNDEELNIDWPEENPILSKKDSNNLSLKEFINTYGSIDIK